MGEHLGVDVDWVVFEEVEEVDTEGFDLALERFVEDVELAEDSEFLGGGEGESFEAVGDWNGGSADAEGRGRGTPTLDVLLASVLVVAPVLFLACKRRASVTTSKRQSIEASRTNRRAVRRAVTVGALLSSFPLDCEERVSKVPSDLRENARILLHA